MTVKLLTEQNLEFLRLKGGCTGSSEYTLVKTPHCWKSHVTTHMFVSSFSGVHHKGKNCKPEEKKVSVQEIIDKNQQHLFPNVISIGSYSGIKLRDPKPNGGWGDLRDRQLCMSFIHNTSDSHR